MVLAEPHFVVAEEIGGLAALSRLRAEWSDLFDRSVSPTPFQRPDWVIPWARSFAPTEPWILSVRAEGRLVGLAPFFCYAAGDERIVAPLGAGVSDYLDVLADRHDAKGVVEALFGWLDARSDRWDTLDFEQLRPGSPLLEAAPRASWSEERREDAACPVLSLPDSLERLPEHVPTSQLAKLRKARRQMSRAGPTHLDVATDPTREEILDALLRLHGARWAQQGSSGVLADAAVQAFHREATRGLLERGVLRLYALRHAGRITASLYALFERNTAYCYLQGFDPDCERFSPGMQILGMVIEDAIAHGLASIDFLRGREGYKYGWGAKDQPTFRRTLRVRRP